MLWRRAIAAVAATSPDVVDEASAPIPVEYEPLPTVTGVEEAMAPDAPNLHPQMRTLGSGDEPTNVPPHSIQRPFLGEHTDEILNEYLGYGADRIAALRAARVVR